jgi:hypothetical protein
LVEELTNTTPMKNMNRFLNRDCGPAPEAGGQMPNDE